MKSTNHATKWSRECIGSGAKPAVTWFYYLPVRRSAQWAVLLAVVASAVSLAAADWPCYSEDAARTSASAQSLAFPLSSAWTYHPAQPPAPAWPEPGREQHRLDFDYAFQPVVADGRVFFGSSADDTVHALGLADGKVQWQFTAGGPVRFAPAYADGGLYVASDDGCLYRLDAETGAVRWRFRAAPSDRKMLGNGRMISRWPCRTGALVVDEVVYVTAGMWPSEEIYIYAIDAETGQPIWKNDTSGAFYRNQPHMGSSAFTGVCPQGYLLASSDLLIVPSGRTTPAAYDRQTGKLVYYQPYLYQLPYDPEGWGNRGNGGAWAQIANDMLLTLMHKGGAPDIDIELGQSGPRSGDGLVAYSLAKGLRMADIPNRHRAVVADSRLYAAGNRLLEAIDLTGAHGAISKATLWTAPIPDERPYSMAAVDDAVLVGGDESVEAYRPGDGVSLWSSAADGQVRGIAVADGRLVIATHRGTIECFASEGVGAGTVTDTSDQLGVAAAGTAARRVSPPHSIADSSHPEAAGSSVATLRGGGHLPANAKSLTDRPILADPQPLVGIAKSQLAGEIVARTEVQRGYALVIGQPDSALAVALAQQTELHVLSFVPNEEVAARDRTKLIEAGLYGIRIAVDVLPSSQQLPYASYFADLVVVAGDQIGESSRTELFRMVHPAGGILYLTDIAPETSRKLGIELDAATIVVTRSQLPGAGDWRYPWADAGKSGIGSERRVRPPFEMLWFGGPGPARMLSRHWGVSAPLAVGSRLFLTGQHSVLAIDAYNGRELWCRPLPGAGRKYALKNGSNFVADATNLYVAIGPVCHRLDQASGHRIAVYRVPGALPAAPGVDGPEGRWGYVSVTDNLLLGSRLRGPASVNEGTSVFALDKASGQARWVHRVKRTVVTTAIALDSDRVLLLDATAPEEAAKLQRRGDGDQVGQTLVALDLEMGQEVWRQDEVPAGHYDVRLSKGVVVVGAVAGYDAVTGKKLWHSAARPERPPLLYNDWVIAQPYAYHLRTGKMRMTTDLLTGNSRPWAFARAYGCGPIAGCQNMLFFRSGTVGVYDFAKEGTTTIGGVRPGCSVTMVTAAGLLLVPEGAGGCSCSYNSC